MRKGGRGERYGGRGKRDRERMCEVKGERGWEGKGDGREAIVVGRINKD